MVLRLRQPSPGRTPWAGGKCLGRPIHPESDEFFPADQKTYQPGLDICNGEDGEGVCPIRDKCLLFALTNNCKIGVWGGTTPVTRRALRKKWPLRKGKQPREEWRWVTGPEAMQLVNGDLGPDDDDDDD